MPVSHPQSTLRRGVNKAAYVHQGNLVCSEGSVYRGHHTAVGIKGLPWRHCDRCLGVFGMRRSCLERRVFVNTCTPVSLDHGRLNQFEKAPWNASFLLRGGLKEDGTWGK